MNYTDQEGDKSPLQFLLNITQLLNQPVLFPILNQYN